MNINGQQIPMNITILTYIGNISFLNKEIYKNGIKKIFNDSEPSANKFNLLCSEGM